MLAKITSHCSLKKMKQFLMYSFAGRVTNIETRQNGWHTDLLQHSGFVIKKMDNSKTDDDLDLEKCFFISASTWVSGTAASLHLKVSIWVKEMAMG